MDPLVLLVEDEEHLARGLAFNLEAQGYRVEVLDRGEPVLERLQGSQAPGVDLIVLDVMLPGISGLEVLRVLRDAGHDVPVLLLTARSRDQEIVEGLDLGADDYLPKPFSLPVLQARVRSLLRRAAHGEEAGELPPSFRIGSCTVRPARFELEREGETRPLTARELGLLLLLQARRGTAVSRAEILREVWELHPDTRTRVVDTFILRLRKLIEPDPRTPRYLLSVRSFGYRLADE